MFGSGSKKELSAAQPKWTPQLRNLKVPGRRWQWSPTSTGQPHVLLPPPPNTNFRGHSLPQQLFSRAGVGPGITPSFCSGDYPPPKQQLQGSSWARWEEVGRRNRMPEILDSSHQQPWLGRFTQSVFSRSATLRRESCSTSPISSFRWIRNKRDSTRG